MCNFYGPRCIYVDVSNHFCALESQKAGNILIYYAAILAKTMQITQRPSPQPIAIAQGKLDYVERFKYLGSVISSYGDIVVEINTRLAKAAAVFRRLDNVCGVPARLA